MSELNKTPSFGQAVGIPTGKLFESQMLGDLSNRAILDSFVETVTSYLKQFNVNERQMEEALNKIVFRDGARSGIKKWKSFEDFFRAFSEKVKRGDSASASEAYYDFNEFLRNIKTPKGERFPLLTDRNSEKNISLEIAKHSQNKMMDTDFSKGVIRGIKEKIPEVRLSFINSLNTSMDYLQKIDFVVAVLNDKNEIVRYYAYDLKTDPTKKRSLMSDVVLICPDDLDADLKTRTKNIIDKVVQNVVERESWVKTSKEINLEHSGKI